MNPTAILPYSMITQSLEKLLTSGGGNKYKHPQTDIMKRVRYILEHSALTMMSFSNPFLQRSENPEEAEQEESKGNGGHQDNKTL